MVKFYFMGVKSMLLRGSGTELHGKHTGQGCGSKSNVCVILMLTVTMGASKFVNKVDFLEGGDKGALVVFNNK